MKFLLKEKTELIIRCFYNVYNSLGYGFLEKVYENALLIELKEHGLKCIAQTPVDVYYKEQIVGSYYTDIIVDREIVLEIKAGVGTLIPAYEKQLSNYLRATEFELGFVFHFGEKASFKRIIFNNDYK